MKKRIKLTKLAKMIDESKKVSVNKFADSELINPKKEMPQVGPFSVMTYFNDKKHNLDRVKYTKLSPKEFKDEELKDYVTEELELTEVEKLTRMYGLLLAGFRGCTAYWEDKDNKIGYIDLVLSEVGDESFSPMIFPNENSNVAIYKNKEGRLSYVADGRVREREGDLVFVNTNKEAYRQYRDQHNNKYKTKYKNFRKLLTNAQWQLAEDQEESGEKELQVKSIMWIGYTDMMDFPTFDDGTPINVVWLDKEDISIDEDEVIWQVPDWKELSDDAIKKIRISSLSQNGVVASAGPLTVFPNGTGRYGNSKAFFGKKAKFDISANQAVKKFKTVNKDTKVFVTLAMVQDTTMPLPTNAYGDCISSYKALDKYITKLTREKSDERNITHPAHKVFMKVNGEIVRVKGASRCMSVTATVDGTVTDEVLILPSHEVTPQGILKEDLEKFQLLVDFGPELKETIIEVKHNSGEVQRIKTVGMWIDVYEDAYHSAVYSLKIKEQNIFYYGGILAMYQKNGWGKVYEAISNSIDHAKLGHALNIIGTGKSIMKKIKLEDIKEKK